MTTPAAPWRCLEHTLQQRKNKTATKEQDSNERKKKTTKRSLQAIVQIAPRRTVPEQQSTIDSCRNSTKVVTRKIGVAATVMEAGTVTVMEEQIHRKDDNIKNLLESLTSDRFVVFEIASKKHSLCFDHVAKR
jgi:hypothetical protein